MNVKWYKIWSNLLTKLKVDNPELEEINEKLVVLWSETQEEEASINSFKVQLQSTYD
jgi:hypothetical protein